MMRAPWRAEAETVHDRSPALERSLAYSAEDGAFALYNDYREGISVLVPRPRTAGREEPALTWGLAGTAGTTHPLSHAPSVEGYGVFTFPYGPTSMGVPEAGKFDVRTYGERVLNLTPIGGFKSRRIRESIVGLTVPDAGLRIERIAGNVAAAHVSAFLAAAESASHTEVRTVELWTRGLAQELQRIYNHVHVIARVAEAASQNVGLAQTHALAEEVLRLEGNVFGHRWLFGALLPGGPQRRLDVADRRRWTTELERLSDRFDDLWELFLETRTFVDRIQTTCMVDRADAIRWGAVGPTLRACDVAWDDRLRIPVPPYTDLFVALPHESGGDALARVSVRAAEVRASFLLIEQMLDRWPASATASEPPSPPVEPGRGIGRVEAPSGDLVYDVQVSQGRVVSVGFRSPSQANWPLFAAGMRDAVFTDFHFALESFGLVFAETDG
jgi:Ni,Fe-hydrogenase III large subunit